MSTMPLRVVRVALIFLIFLALVVFCFQNAAVLSARLQLYYDLGFVRVAPFSAPVYALLLVAFLVGLFVDGLIGLVYWYKAAILEERLRRLSKTKARKESEETAILSAQQEEKEGTSPWDEPA
jgi:uncharacterized membrane protein YciS (DUF1049 family)